MTSFNLATWIDATPETVYDLSRNVSVHARSMAESGEEAVGGVTEGLLELGQDVTWRARHFGVTFHMTSRITEADGPNHFVDELHDGPFQSWRHLHVFEPDATGIRMIDGIEYEAPLGMLGRFADRLILRRYMIKLISQRNQYIKGAAEPLRD